MKIGVDVDQCLRDLVKSVVQVFSRHNPDVVLGEMPDTYHGWENIDLSPKETRRLIFGEWVEAIFLGAPECHGAKNGFEHLVAWAHLNNHTVVCVSKNGGYLADLTMRWLSDHGFVFDEYHFTADKSTIGLEYIINDSPGIFKQWIEAGNDSSRFVLIDYPYNRDILAVPRVPDIANALTYISHHYHREN